MHLSSRVQGAPYEVPLGPINELMDFSKQKDELHDIIGHATKARFSYSGSASHVEKIGFPTCQFGIHIVQEEIEIRINRLLSESGEAQVFLKGIAGFDA